ncbi:MAG TPA: MFS transporter [Streptosporangiaceae bacterium]|nr:MFS transporter [Streptosporangiaceae bacterium]
MEDEIAGTASTGLTGETPAPPVVFRDVFAVAEFRALWLAQILSVAGDQLARVALTVLVYNRTLSPLLAAVTYAASFVPTFVGGVTLGGLADRFPRRAVMIACDLVRAVLVLVMAISGLPIPVLVGLLFAVTLAGAPFTSARAAVYPDVLPGDRYVLGNALVLTTNQLAQVIGFAVGGTLVGFLGTGPSLIIDAATFIVSGLIVRFRTVRRPAARPAAAPPGAGQTRAGRIRAGHGLLASTRLVLTRPALRDPMLFGWLAAFYNAPEGIAVPLAHSLGGGSVTVGAVLAAEPFGAMLGSLAFSRLVAPSRRMRWMGPLATAASAVLVLFAFRLGLVAVLAVLFAAGVFAAFQLAANAAFVQAAPPEYRSQAFGLAQGGMSLGQGLLMVLAGAALDLWSPGPVIAAFGILGTLAALAVIADHSRASRPARGRRQAQAAPDRPEAQPAPAPAPAHPDTPAVPAFLAAPVDPASPAAQQTTAGTDVPVGDSSDRLAGPEPGATNFPAASPRGSRGRHRAH